MKKFNLKYQVAAGVILIIVGTLVLLTDYIKEKRDVVFSEMNLALSSLNEVEAKNDEVIEDTNEETKEEIDKKSKSKRRKFRASKIWAC